MRLGVPLSRIEPFIAISGPSLVAFRLPAGYNEVADECDTPVVRAKVEKALSELLGRPVAIGFERGVDGSPGEPPLVGETVLATRRREEVLEGDPLIRKVVELFEARLLHPEYDDDPPRTPAR